MIGTGSLGLLRIQRGGSSSQHLFSDGYSCVYATSEGLGYSASTRHLMRHASQLTSFPKGMEIIHLQVPATFRVG